MKPSHQRFLREAFLTSMPIEKIARRVPISESTIWRFWADEKAAGRLPAVRPHFAARCKLAAPVEAETAPGIDRDASPIGDPNPTYQAECARLLAALRHHHGEPWRRLQIMPAHTLEMEFGDKRKGVLPAPPSPLRARELAQTADVYTAALLKRGIR